MRLKEFLITIFCFTIFYILFFIIFDKIMIAHEKKKEIERLNSILNETKYMAFAQFYGVQSKLSNELLWRIFQEVPRMPSISISEYSSSYQITPYELVVAIVYLEYHQLVPLKEVYFEGNVIIPIRQNHQTLVSKYLGSFAAKMTYEGILNNFGQVALRDLLEINQLFLCPGVRIIGNQIYYVGDINEKS